MTKPTSHSHTARSGLFRSSCRLLLAMALSAAALPVLAQSLPTSSLRGDAADAPSATTRTLMPEAMTLSDRALMLATDVNRLVSPGTTHADAGAGGMKSVLQRAMALLGTPYRWGGTTPDNGFDCSGLVGYVFRNALGLELPRVSRDLAKTGQLVGGRAALSEGDLVFFGRSGRVDHVGIYVGEGRFVHAPSSGKDVMVSSLDTGYWSNKYMSARRVADI